MPRHGAHLVAQTKRCHSRRHRRRRPGVRPAAGRSSVVRARRRGGVRAVGGQAVRRGRTVGGRRARCRTAWPGCPCSPATRRRSTPTSSSRRSMPPWPATWSRPSRAPGAWCSATPRTTAWSPTCRSLIPEVNPHHLDVLDAQRARRGWSGGIVTNANCASIPAAMALAPLHQRVRRAARVHGHHAGGVGRRISRRPEPRHPRQRHPVHRRRGAEDRDRDQQDAGARERGAPSGRRRSRSRRTPTGCRWSTGTRCACRWSSSGAPGPAR